MSEEEWRAFLAVEPPRTGKLATVRKDGRAHVAPIWFDPADISGIITPFMVLYALHDALVKPMPGQPLASSLAESCRSAVSRPLTFRLM